MATCADPRVLPALPRPLFWLPLALLPTAVIGLANDWPAWAFMWVVALSVYFGLKWFSLTAVADLGDTATARLAGYLLLWPGMDAQSFLRSPPHDARPWTSEWLWSAFKTAGGLALMGLATALVEQHPTFAGWVAMAGLLFTLHCGLFHVLSAAWRSAGRVAPPIMRAPILASSLSDFWGRRWNLAFRDFAHLFVFRPLVRRWGAAAATMAVFLFSGVVHDVVISIPAHGGYGWPTLYFLLQGIGVLWQRGHAARRWGVASGVKGRVFCAAVVVVPVGLLFHAPFIHRVIVPMLVALGTG